MERRGGDDLLVEAKCEARQFANLVQREEMQMIGGLVVIWEGISGNYIT